MKDLLPYLKLVTLRQVVFSAVSFVLLYLILLLTSCHALVIADKLVYQGTLGKKQSNVEVVNDSVNISNNSY